MIRHLFWDFDGTLYDSYPIVTQSFWEGLAMLGVGDQIDKGWLYDQLKHSLFYGAQLCAEKTGADPQAMMDNYRICHVKYTSFPPYEGLEDCLRTLKEAGFCHYLYTHRNHVAVDQLKRDGLWPLFSDSVTSDDGFALKPAPNALNALMQRNGLSPDKCAMVGDRDIDIEAGHNAGMIGILFDPDGYYAGYPAELHASGFAQLKKMLLRQ